MKSLLHIVLVFIILTQLFSCKANGAKVLSAVTGNIMNNVSVSSDLDTEMGEIVTTEDSTTITVTVRNNSSNVIKNLAMDIDPTTSLMNFAPDEEGLVSSPGFEGTCLPLLDPGQTCTFKMALSPRKIGEFTIPVNLTWLNLITTESAKLQYHMVLGTAATLNFTNNKSTYNFGIIEQTDTTVLYQDLEIANNGDLPARNLQVDLSNTEEVGAFSLVSHNCPSVLKATQTCSVRISYVPRNNLDNDPETLFTGILSLSFFKNPKKDTGNLSAYFSMTASRIEARFKLNMDTLTYDQLISGNKQVRAIKVTNYGYRDGILNNFIFNTPTGSPLPNGQTSVTCQKGSGAILDCGYDVSIFPFVIEDLNSCIGTNVPTYLDTGANPNCYFNITYWPSSTWKRGTETAHDFNASLLTIRYNSLWRSNETIITTNSTDTILHDTMEVTATFAGKAELQLTDVQIESVSKTITNGVTNLGRIAKLLDNSESYSVKLTYTNVGGSSATLAKFIDGKNRILISSGTDDPLYATYPTEYMDTARPLANTYYYNIKQQNCVTIDPDGTCFLTFDIIPVAFGVQATEDLYMYDDTSVETAKFKTIKFQYADGGAYLDNGTASTSNELSSNFISTLIAKGKLKFLATSYDFGTMVEASAYNTTGAESIKHILIKNNGTGNVRLLQSFVGGLANTLYVPNENSTTCGTQTACNTNNGAASSKPFYPYRISSYSSHGESLPNGATVDCYPLLHINPSETITISSYDVSKILESGKTCALRVNTVFGKNAGIYTSAPTYEYARTWDYKALSSGNAQDMWSTSAANYGASVDTTLKFTYYDGDDNSASDALALPVLGYSNTLASTALTVKDTKAAQFYISDISPLASAVYERPAITYSAVTDTFPYISSITNTTGAVIRDFTKQDLVTTTYDTSMHHAADLQRYMKAVINILSPIPDTPVINAGAITIGTDLTFSATITNGGGESARLVSIAQDYTSTTPNPFTVTSFNGITSNIFSASTSIAGGGQLAIAFKFNASTVGDHESCYHLYYTSYVGAKDYKFCVTATAISTMPKLKIEYKNADTEYDIASASKDAWGFVDTFDTSWTSYTAPLNNEAPSSTIALTIPFSTAANLMTPTVPTDIGRSRVTKKIQLTNIGTAAFTSLSIRTLSTALEDKTTSLPSFFSMPSASELNNCKTLAVNASCTLTISYKPTAQVSATAYLLGFSYPVNDKTSSLPSGVTGNAITYANQYLKFSLEATTLPEITAIGYASADTATSWTNPGANLSTSDYSIPAKGFDTAAKSFPLPLVAPYTYNTSTYVMSSTYNTSSGTTTMYVKVTAPSSSSNISFLKANENPGTGYSQVYPAYDKALGTMTSIYVGKDDTWSSAYSATTAPGAFSGIIYANKYCFYGDTGVNNGTNTQGFNSGSTNPCILKVVFSGKITYPVCNKDSTATTTGGIQYGGEINKLCNPYVFTVPYYAYKRSNYQYLKFHANAIITNSSGSGGTPISSVNSAGFIEPVRSTYSGSFSNVTSTISSNLGKITFTLPTSISALDTTQGDVVRYRILMAKDPSFFRWGEIFRKTAQNPTWKTNIPSTNIVEVTSTSTPVTFTGLTLNTYYFFKVMAIRNNLTYGEFLSDPKIPLLVVPTLGAASPTYTYIDDLKSFVDHSFIDAKQENRLKSDTKCAASSQGVLRAGTAKASPRALITPNIYINYIAKSLVPSNYTNIGFWPHWMNTTKYNLSGSLLLYDGSTISGYPSLNSAIKTATSTNPKIRYSKSCATSSCNDLYLMLGGDLDNFTNMAMYLEDATTVVGYTRCYVPVVCPENTAYKLSNTTSCKLSY